MSFFVLFSVFIVTQNWTFLWTFQSTEWLNSRLSHELHGFLTNYHWVGISGKGIEKWLLQNDGTTPHFIVAPLSLNDHHHPSPHLPFPDRKSNHNLPVMNEPTITLETWNLPSFPSWIAFSNKADTSLTPTLVSNVSSTSTITLPFLQNQSNKHRCANSENIPLFDRSQEMASGWPAIRKDLVKCKDRDQLLSPEDRVVVETLLEVILHLCLIFPSFKQSRYRFVALPLLPSYSFNRNVPLIIIIIIINNNNIYIWFISRIYWGLYAPLQR